MIKNNKKLEKKLIKYLESIIKDIKSEKISIIPNSIDFSENRGYDERSYFNMVKFIPNDLITSILKYSFYKKNKKVT